MLKFSISNANVFLYLQHIPLVRNFFVYYLPNFWFLDNHDEEDTLFAALRYGDVTGKATAQGRFSDIDSIALQMIADGYAIHDVGVSSGITSFDLYCELQSAGRAGNFTISDKFAEMEFSRGMLLTRIYDSDSKLKSIYLLGVLFDPQISWVYFLSKITFQLLKFIPDYSERVRILLLSAPIKQLLQNNEIKFISYDVFNSKLNVKYSFVRCMNLLNRSYFSDDQLLVGINNLFNSLQEGGILLIGRTIKIGSNGASFYRKEGGVLRVVKEINGGSEIRNLVEQINSNSVTSQA